MSVSMCLFFSADELDLSEAVEPGKNGLFTLVNRTVSNKHFRFPPYIYKTAVFW